MATASAPRQQSENLQPIAAVPNRKKFVRLTLWPLVAATFFMVSGGTYGTEDIVHGAGYGRAILILLITPLLWSLPTAFMIGELSSALPYEGGYYAWVRRAMGNFWGFQEAWLSLIASIFDMAIYPTLFVAYLTRMFPWFQEANRGWWVALAVVVACALLNIAGVKVVSLTSLWLFLALSAPFAAIVILAPFKLGALANAVTKPTTSTVDILGGLLICMWNYMGWDNASTIATEVERPQRTYPRAMLVAVCIVAVSYILPFAAMWMTGLKPTAWETGSWADIAGLIGGPLLRIGVVLGGLDQRLRHVQCASDELLAPASGDGARWHAARSLRQAAKEIARPLGRHHRARHRLGHVPRTWLRPPRHARHPSLRCQPVPGIHGAGCAPLPRTEPAAPFQSARRIIRRDRHRHSSYAPPRLLRSPQRARANSQHELVRLRNDPHRGWLRGLPRQSCPEA